MKRMAVVLSSAILLAIGVMPAVAQDKYPSKPIKVVVPFGPGSATDIVMRIVGEHMRPILGQPVLLENKPGASGIISIHNTPHSPPDATTLPTSNHAPT